MGINLNDIREAMKEVFHPDDFVINESSAESSNRWIQAVPKKLLDYSGIHYEVLQHGEDFYVELHFELYKNQLPDIREKLTNIFVKNRRQYEMYTYYSSVFWKARSPVVDTKTLGDDLKSLYDLTNNLLCGEDVDWGRIEEECPLPANARLELSAPVSLAKIASMIAEGESKVDVAEKGDALVMPAVQRGRVWNAARCATLWDSILNDFPIGSFSVKRQSQNEKVFDLLDGQQRATTIALGFDDNFNLESDTSNRPILWLDINPVHKDGDLKYAFRVTTPSQPWGYSSESSETSNELLPQQSRYEACARAEKAAREDTKIFNIDSDSGKPTTTSLFPSEAVYPVPFSSLRKYVDECKGEYSLKCFIDKQAGVWKNALNEDCAPDEGVFRDLCGRIKEILTSYTVFLLDAGNVADQDIALYFTRIGKGGVVPSNEELAYSILKSKLDVSFRNTVEEIVETYGLSSAYRVASLWIRLYRSVSGKDGGQSTLYSGSVFDEAVKIGRDKKEKEDLLKFGDVFNSRIKCLDDLLFRSKTKGGLVDDCRPLTQWHRCRYCQEDDGNVYLFLLIAIGDDRFHQTWLAGLAELLFGYATSISYAANKILAEGPTVAIARLLVESRYRTRRMSLPCRPKEIEDMIEGLNRCREVKEWYDSISNDSLKWQLSEGYGSTGRKRSFNILLRACRKSNGGFSYNPNVGVWSEDNCPWDYDHIMPHSLVDRMKKSKEKEVCAWLVNSIGNLAPLPFRVNRSLSNSRRKNDYPNAGEITQADLCLNGDDVAAMWNDEGDINVMKFARFVVTRYANVYKDWFEGLNINEILDWDGDLKEWEKFPGARVVCSRLNIINAIKNMVGDDNYEIRYVDGDVEVLADSVQDVLGRDYVTLSKDCGEYSIALSRGRTEGGNWEIGVRKAPSKTGFNPDVMARITAWLKQNNNCDDFENWSTSQWWCIGKEYGQIDIDNCDNICKELKALDERIEQLLKEHC